MDAFAELASRRAFSFALILLARSISRFSASAFALARFASRRGSPVDLTGFGGCAAFHAADPGLGGSPALRSTTPKYRPSPDFIRYFASEVYMTRFWPDSRARSAGVFPGLAWLSRNPASTSANMS